MQPNWYTMEKNLAERWLSLAECNGLCVSNSAEEVFVACESGRFKIPMREREDGRRRIYFGEIQDAETRTRMEIMTISSGAKPTFSDVYGDYDHVYALVRGGTVAKLLDSFRQIGFDASTTTDTPTSRASGSGSIGDGKTSLRYISGFALDSHSSFVETIAFGSTGWRNIRRKEELVTRLCQAAEAAGARSTYSSLELG